MPFTPFHFGPGLLVKGMAPRWFSMSAFVASQVVIDVESLYWLLQDAWPVHRGLHTFVGGTIVGLAVALALHGVARTAIGRRLGERYGLVADLGLTPLLVGGLIGGLSHSMLDGIMHPDIQPFRPMFDDNPLLGRLSVLALHLACVVAGGLGLGVLMLRRSSRREG